MDTEMQNINQGVHLQIKEEKFENDTSCLENLDYTNCFETMDLHVKMEIDVHDTKQHIKQDLWNECFHSPNIVNQHINVSTGFGNINQDGKLQEERFENDKSHFENVDYTHYFKNVGSDFKDKSKEDDDKFVEIMLIKQEIIDNYEQTENTNNPKDVAEFEDMELIIETKSQNYDLAPGSSQPKSNKIKNSCVNLDLKAENVAVSNEESNLKHENNDPYIDMGDHGNMSRTSNFNIDDNSPFTENLDLKIEFIGLDIDKRDLTCEKPDLNINKCVSDVEVINFMTDSCEKEHNESHLRKDLTSYSIEYQVKCKLCDKVFPSSGYLRSHMVRHSTEKPHKCSICESGFKRKTELKKHMITHSTEHPHKCNLCEKAFKHTRSLTHHMITHSTEHPHKCNLCKKAFKVQNQLTKHMLTHITEHPHKCNMCEKAFKVHNQLTKHMLTHSTERPHKCNLCEKAFKTKDSLRNHMIRHGTEKPHKCNICETVFKTNDNLTQHMSIHSTEYLHNSNICEKSFTNINYLTQHMPIHSTEHPHECDMCQKAFKTKRNLTCHMRIHSTEHPHKCDICEKAFKTTNTLERHMVIHSTEKLQKSLKCNICETGFKTKMHLTHHMQIHSTEHPH